MLATLLKNKPAAADGIVDGVTRWPWHRLCERVAAMTEDLAEFAHQEVAVAASSPAALLALLAALNELQCHVTLLPAGDHADELDWTGTRRPANILDVDDWLHTRGTSRSTGVSELSTRTAEGGSLTIFSSGTTGRRKRHRWRWSRLLERIAIPEGVTGGCFLSAYPIDTFAGIQALLFAAAGADRFVRLAPQAELSTAGGGEADIRLAMGTPTFWRRVVLCERPENLCKLKIGTISMGGEPATQDLLDQLSRVIPKARLVHVYASSEHGSLFSVSDGMAGFPAEWLGRRLKSKSTLDVRDGELYVSPASDQEFRPTGDAVHIEGNRVLFDGRVGDVINVAGRKVNAMQVESALRKVPAVADAVAYGIPSQLAGSLVAADVVLHAGQAGDPAKEAIHAHFRKHHPPHERPRRIRFVDSLEATRSGKRNRRR